MVCLLIDISGDLNFMVVDRNKSHSFVGEIEFTTYLLPQFFHWPRESSSVLICHSFLDFKRQNLMVI